MGDRYGRYARPRSPVYNPARASLPINLTGHAHPASHEHHMHVVPTSRREIIPPRGTSSTGSTAGTVTTTYKIKADLPPARGSSVREGSRTRRSNTVDSNARPTVVTAVQRHRPVVHSGRPASPLKNPYRSSEEEYYTVPATSKHGHSHRKRYSATMDNADMNRLATERETNRLSIAPAGRERVTYTGTRSRPSYPTAAVRHPDTVSDDYGDDGYGYTNPRDLVQYDLNNNTTSRNRSRKDSFESGRASRPTSITGYNDIVPRTYEARERGPPPTTRGFDRIPRGGTWEQTPQIRMPVVPPPPPMDPIQRPARVDPPFDEQPIRRSGSRRPTSYHAESKRGPRDDYYEVRDEEPRRESRSHRHEPRYDDAVEQRGFGIRPERPERPDRPERVERVDRPERPERIERPEKFDRSDRPERAERSERSERERPERPDRPDRTDDRSEHKSGRDALAAGIGLAGAALGLNAVKNAKRDDRDDRESSSEREERRRRDRDERPRKHRDSRDDTIDLGDRDPKERRRRDDERDRDVPPPPRDIPPPPRDLPTQPRDIPPPPRVSPPIDRDARSAPEPAFIDLSRNQERPAPRYERESDSDRPERPERRRHRSDSSTPRTGSDSSASPPPPVRPRSRAGKEAGAGPPAFNPKDAMDLMAMKAALNAKDNEPPKPANQPVAPPRSPRASATRTSQEAAEIRNDLNERRPRDPLAPTDNRQLRVVSPPREKVEEKKAVKGILRQPREKFPEDPSPIREGVAPLKDAKKDGVPPDARWTKISRKLVNPEALELGKERYESRDDFVIVLRVLSRDEVQGYAEVTQKLRAAREEAEELEASNERRRARRERHERHKRERSRGDRPEHAERRRHGHSESDTTDDEGEGDKPLMLEPPPLRKVRMGGNNVEDLLMSGGLGGDKPPPPASVATSGGSSRGKEEKRGYD